MNELSSSLEEQIRQAKLRAENFSKSLRQAREQEAATLKTFEDGRMKWASGGDLKSSRNSVNTSEENNLNRLSRDSGVNSLRDSSSSVNVMIGEEKHSQIDFKKEAELLSQISALEKQLKVQRSEIIVSNAELRVAKAHSAALEQKLSAQFMEDKKSNPSVGQLSAMEAFAKTLQSRLDENEKKIREERKEFSRNEAEFKLQIKLAEQQVKDLLMQKDGLVTEISVHRKQGEIFVQALENANIEIDRLCHLLELSKTEVSQLKRSLDEIERMTESNRSGRQQGCEPPVFDDSILEDDISGGDLAIAVNEISSDSNMNSRNLVADDKYVSVINSELERSQKSHENLKQLIDSFRRSEEDQVSSFPHIAMSAEPPVYPAVKTFPPPPPLLGGRYHRVPFANPSDNINELRRSPEMIKRTADTKPKVAVSGSKNTPSSRTTSNAKAAVPVTRKKSSAPPKSSARPINSSRQPGSVVSTGAGKRSINVVLPTSKYSAITPPRLLSKKEALPTRGLSSSHSSPVSSASVTGRVVQVVSNVERKQGALATRSIVRKSTDSSGNRNSSSSNIIISKSRHRTVDDIIHDITALSASISSSLSWNNREKAVVKSKKGSGTVSGKTKQGQSGAPDTASLESLSSDGTDVMRSTASSSSAGRKKRGAI